MISGTAHSPRAAPGTAQPRVVEVATWTPEKDALVRRAIAMVLLSVKMFFATLKHVTRRRCRALCDGTVRAALFGRSGDEIAQGVGDSPDRRSLSRSPGDGRFGAAAVRGGQDDSLCQWPVVPGTRRDHHHRARRRSAAARLQECRKPQDQIHSELGAAADRISRDNRRQFLPSRFAGQARCRIVRQPGIHPQRRHGVRSRTIVEGREEYSLSAFRMGQLGGNN